MEAAATLSRPSGFRIWIRADWLTLSARVPEISADFANIIAAMTSLRPLALRKQQVVINVGPLDALPPPHSHSGPSALHHNHSRARVGRRADHHYRPLQPHFIC